MDSEEEGEFLVSCAGGARAHLILKPEWVSGKEGAVYSIQIRNLKGGHSGQEIDKGRGNANKMMGRILFDLQEKISFNLISVNGGLKDNAIPREMDAVVQVDNDVSKLTEIIDEWNEIFKNEYSTSDGDVTVKLELVRNQLTKFYQRN